MTVRAGLSGRVGGSGAIVGIDAGGSSTRVRAMLHGTCVYEGTGGPGNPLLASEEAVRASYHAVLEGCPAAAQVAACVSGAGSQARREQVAGLLTDRFPGAVIRVEPDCVAGFLAAPPVTDVCVVAGTGSVVCSQAADGSYPRSGGYGWILGDHGGAARLGRAALERYVADPAAAPDTFVPAIVRVFRDEDPRSVVRAVHATPNPAPLLARLAPMLTAAAEKQVPWAAAVLDAEMLELAVTAARHVDRYLPPAPAVHIALAGGVWESPAATSSFIAALERVSRRRPIVARSLADPVEGAVRLAESIRR